MKKHLMPEVKEGGVNVTPLIDIVMCLIIFFMLVAKIGVSTGADASIEPPSTLYGQKIPLENTLTLNVKAPASKLLEQPEVKALLESGGDPTPIPVRKEVNGVLVDEPLMRTLKEAVDGNPARGIKPNPEFKVIILAEKSLEYSMLEQVLMACAKAHVKNVNFQTKEGAGAGSEEPAAAVAPH